MSEEKLKHFQVGDYIEGTEYFGRTTKRVRGWVAGIVGRPNAQTYFNIQADDNWNGARGTSVFPELGEIKLLKQGAKK